MVTIHQLISSSGKKKKNMMSIFWMNTIHFITLQKAYWFFSKLWVSCQLWEVHQVKEDGAKL